MTASSRTLLGLLCLALHLQRAAAICYYPDGTASSDTPCSDDSKGSACCGAGYACYGTSAQFYLCQATGDELQKSGASEFVRGSCTDESWSSSKCPNMCVDGDRDYIGGGNGVGQCPDSDTEYYCISEGLGEDNCTTGWEIVNFVSEPSALTTIGVVASTSSEAASSTLSSASSFMSSSATTTSSSTLTASTKATTTTSPVVTVTSTPYHSNSDDDSDSSSNTTAIGVGVGVGVGALVIIAALTFWLIRRRNQKRADANAAASVAGFPSAGSGGGSPPNMDKAPTGYAPTPNLGSPAGTMGTLVPPPSTSPYPPSELYDSPAPAYKASQPHIGEMPNTQPASRYEMA